MKKLWKAGIAGAIACTALVGTVCPVSANTQSTGIQNDFTEAAAEVMPRFMYTRVETVTGFDFDTIVTFDTSSTTQTTSGWRIVGLQDVEIVDKFLSVIGFSYTYKYYDNYQGLEIDITYYHVSGGVNYTGHKTVKVHV